MRSLNQFYWLRDKLIAFRRHWLAWSTGAIFAQGVEVSLSATLIGGTRGSITIGEATLVAFKTLLIARSPDGSIAPIRIGRHCFIGGGATILPGVTIGDECIVAAGAVVMDDAPSRSIVAGSPAKILKISINVKQYGRFSSVNSQKSLSKFYS
jgi:maltose O-acetyltransferase